MTTPNLFIVYVRDAERATDFYRRLFDMEPAMITPRYVPFEIAPGVLFAVWTGGSLPDGAVDAPRTSEIGLMVHGGADAVDATYAEWVERGARTVQEPHDDVFGRTFVVADPDGNLIRVAPFD